MIYVQNPTITAEEFEQLLNKTKSYCLKQINDQKLNAMQGVPFENLVFQQMSDAAIGTKFENEIEQTGLQTFPDIIAKKYYGAEVKVTTDDKWLSTGNSILESTRRKDVERIYMFFGKLGGKPDIKYCLYQDCLFDIGVTHSPRYKIDMNLLKGQSIFDKIGIGYDTLRKDPNSIQKIKNYYRTQLKEGEELWWIDSKDSDTVNIKVTPFRNLDADIKKKFFTEAMILFPEIFILKRTKNKKYERAAAYLITKYNSFNASFRDIFSAGGRQKLTIKSKRLSGIPKILHELYANSQAIKTKIEQIPKEDLLYYWGLKTIEGSRLSLWKKLLNANCDWKKSNIKPTDIFEAGLE